jgi:hypothetical protein
MALTVLASSKNNNALLMLMALDSLTRVLTPSKLQVLLTPTTKYSQTQQLMQFQWMPVAVLSGPLLYISARISSLVAPSSLLLITIMSLELLLRATCTISPS